MIGFLQRVSQARVDIHGVTTASIGPGLMVLVGIQQADTTADAERLVQRLLNYRVFPDAQGRMNLSLLDTAGELLLVPQFTLAADTRKGNRPSFTSAAEPSVARSLYAQLVQLAKQQLPGTASGSFGADMQVSLTNEGPVSFWLCTG